MLHVPVSCAERECVCVREDKTCAPTASVSSASSSISAAPVGTHARTACTRQQHAWGSSLHRRASAQRRQARPEIPLRVDGYVILEHKYWVLRLPQNTRAKVPKSISARHVNQLNHTKPLRLGVKQLNVKQLNHTKPRGKAAAARTAIKPTFSKALAPLHPCTMTYGTRSPRTCVHVRMS